MKDRFRGTLLGCAIGDTLGMPVEMWSADQIKKYWGKIVHPVKPKVILDEKGEKITSDEFGKLKYWFEGLDAGDYTDDTILTIAIAESLIEKGMDLEDCAIRQLREYEKRLNIETGFNGGFGKTTVDAFKNLQSGMSPRESGIIGGPGNGNAMKMSPVGLYMYSGSRRYHDGLEYAKAVSKITHLDPRSVVAGILQACAIHDNLTFVSRNDFIELLEIRCEKEEEPLDERFTWHKSGSLLSRIVWIRKNRDMDDKLAHAHLGSSSAVYQSYAFALFMFQKYWDNPLEGLIETVNYGGDCDTTGAIYGALAGARHGIFFPTEWIVGLKDHEKIIDLADKLYELRTKNYKIKAI